MEDKEQLHCYISRDVLERLREIVVRENGFFARGMISQYVEKAIRRQMGRRMENKATHTHIKLRFERTADEQQAMAEREATELRDKIVTYLVDRLRYEKQPRIKIGLSQLRGAIYEVERVKDGRSIRSRITVLESSGFLSQSDPEFKIYEIITGYHPDLDSKAKEELR